MRLSDPYNVSEFRSRSLVIAVLFATLIGILILRLWYLQIWQGELYREFSDENRFKIERLSAPRGQIFDRSGNLIADSRPRFDVLYTRGNSQDLEMELSLLGDILGWEKSEIDLRLEKLKKSPRYQSQVMMLDIPSSKLALLQMKALDLPGLDIEVVAVRDYLYKEAFFHSVGYTGEIGEKELQRLRARFPQRSYRRGDQRGIIGLEALNEGLLRGTDGRNFLVVDVNGRRVNSDQWEMLPETSRIDPVAGTSLKVSLDLGLQLEAVKAFGSMKGAAVAMDPQTGQVLAYVSQPALDPNWFTQVLTNLDFQKALNREDNPFLDRVVGEHYPPGSTFKLVMAAAALENAVIDGKSTHYCPGFYRFGRRSWNCHKRDGHGRVDVVQAIAQSCDVFFYNVASSLGLDAMFSWSNRFGLGRRTYVGSEVLEGPQERIYRFNTEQTGFIPYQDWVRMKGNTTVEAETINAGIGQGAFLTTVMQLARMVAGIGNGGRIFQPQLVLSENPQDSERRKDLRAEVENHLRLEDKTRSLIIKGMEEVISGQLGTARLSKIPQVQFGGKTGTAQVVDLEVWRRRAKTDKKLEDHGLFVGLAPLDDPRIAVAVIVENGGHGSGTAAPIAKKMVQYYMQKLQTTEVNDGTTAN